jgi:hypothetical protein
VGITHAERGNRTGALRLIGRARGRLERYVRTGQPSYGLPLAEIVDWIRSRENAADAAGSWLDDQPL